MQRIRLIAVALALSFAQWRMMLLTVDWSYMVGQSYAVLEGHAEWYVWQSRILAPLIIEALGNDLNAYRDLTIAGLTISGILAYRLAGWSGLFLMHTAFAAILCKAFLPWDALELPIWMTFVWLVNQGGEYER